MTGATITAGTPPAVGRGTTERALGLVACLLILGVVVALSILVGAKPLSPSEVWQAFSDPRSGEQATLIVHDLRIPRTVLGVLVGAAMAVAGGVMMALTRNPLADPGLLGVNVGAALAVVVAVAYLGVTSIAGYVWFALAGAAAVSVLVYVVGSAGQAGATPVRLALAGTAASAALSGAISAIVLTNLQAFRGFRAWSVGSLSGRDLQVFWQVLPFIVVGLALALTLGRSLNALALGDELASALGARVALVRLLGAVSVTLLCGAGTAAVGPIAFVGLVVPHLIRPWTGPSQVWILPYCVVLGPILLLGSDVVGRLVVRPAELDVSVVTAIIGAPVFIAIVRRRRLMQL